MASILKVDDLRGNTAAGNITITSEGGAVTMQLQQGVAKAWLDHTQVTTTAARDSLNISSITDAGTGKSYPISFTNNMNNDDYAVAFYAAATATTTYSSFNNGYAGGMGSKTTSSFGHGSYGTSSFIDSVRNDDIIHGDLA